MKKIELLLPAGNWDSLKAAVENGADAVYLGVNKFNARIRANNFTLENIKEVTDYCHENGVRVYCTTNILIKNSEIKDFFDTITKLYQANVDAVIIQEISFLPIIKSNFPDLEVHISTQAAINNTSSLPLLKQADKIVLPRELSIEEIKDFTEKTKIPIEVFVQGALCFSYSGKCLFSSMIGGRSGNRGMCAQPCRRKYNGKYLLSMKDLCLIDKIPELIKIGVSTLKIEGRLRSPKYVVAAAKLYRSAIDSYYQDNFTINKKLFKEMKLAFNREFTEGYFSKQKELVSHEKPMGRGLLVGTIKNNNLILLKEDISVGDGLGIWLKNKVDGALLRKIEKNGQEVKKAKRGEEVKLFIRAPPETKIYKTSSIEKNIEISFKKNSPITITRKEIKLQLPEVKKEESKKEQLLVKVYSKQDAKIALENGADKVFYNLLNEDFDKKYSAYIPRLLDNDDINKAIKKINELNIKEALVGDLGAYTLLKNKLEIYLDYSINTFNDYDVDFFQPSTTIISPELSFKELTKFKNKNFAVLIHGKLILMNTKYEHLPKKITDEKKYSFPVRKEHNYFQIINSRELGLFEKVLRLKEVGIKNYFLDLDDNIEKTVRTYRDILNGKQLSIKKKGYTIGHWERGTQ